jgi:hypothetical protein
MAREVAMLADQRHFFPAQVPTYSKDSQASMAREVAMLADQRQFFSCASTHIQQGQSIDHADTVSIKERENEVTAINYTTPSQYQI